MFSISRCVKGSPQASFVAPDDRLAPQAHSKVQANWKEKK